MEQQERHPSPEMIMKIGTGFWASKVLMAAVNFNLFTLLAEHGTMSANEIKQKLGLNCIDRHVLDFLDTLTGFGFLNREGMLETARYSNGMDSDVFLDRNKPSYIGGIIEMFNNRLYGFWGSLEDGLKSGKPQNEAKHGGDLFGELYSDPKRLEEFIQAMSGIQMGNFMTFAQHFNFTDYNTLTDAGGSSGLLSLMVAKHNPHMSCVSFDLPEVEPIAKGTIEHFQLADRVKTASGDFFRDPIPAADVIVMGNVLHDWDAETKVALMRKAYDSLPEGGSFVAIENIIDKDRKENLLGLMMSLNMLIETGKGFDYTFQDFNGWADKAGFSSASILPLPGPASAAIAVK